MSSVSFITIWLHTSADASSSQRSLISSTSRSKSTFMYSRMWNRNSGTSAYAPAVTLVIDEAPLIRGLSSPRYTSPVSVSTSTSTSKNPR